MLWGDIIKGNVILSAGLSDSELQGIRELENVCCGHEKLNMKLNWDMLVKRPTDESNDFLYYTGNKLIGYLGFYGFGAKPIEIEITGMVHPDFRRKGVFKELFDTAKQECINRGAEKLLLITERSSKTGESFVKFTGSRYSFSEYRMKFDETAVPVIPKTGITLRKAEARDYPELINLDALCFGVSKAEVKSNNLSDAYNSVYIAELEGKSIGKIGVSMEREAGYIFGFGIKPEYRRQGNGRQLLSLMLSKLLSEQVNTVLLEVAVENENALFLYKSCGFKEITVYDYYKIVLQQQMQAEYRKEE